MTELTRQITKGWLIVKPDHKPAWVESSAEVDQRTAAINAFLQQAEVEPLYRPDEVLANPENKQLALHSPHEMMAIQILDANGRRITRHCKRLFKTMLAEIPYTEVRYAKKMGETTIVTLPADLGPPEQGKPPHELTMSMLMEKPHTESPLILVGRGDEFAQLEKNAPQFQPIRFSAKQFAAINHQLDSYAHEFSTVQKDGSFRPAKWVRLPSAMISAQSNVAEINYYHEAGKFFIMMEFVLTDGSKHVRLINHSQKIADEIMEGNNYCIVVTALGEKHFVVIYRRRVNGEDPEFIGKKVAFPKAFMDGDEFMYKHRIASDQTGIEHTNIRTYQTNLDELLVQNPTRQDVRSNFTIVEMPPGTDFQLEAKQAAKPLAPVEQLVPTLLSVKDAIEAIMNGTLFNDDHTIAMMATYLLRNQIITLRDTLADGTPIDQLRVVMAVVPDYRTGDSRLTIWRGDTEPHQQLIGARTYDSGITRNWQHVGLADGLAAKETIQNTTKPWQTISLVELVKQVTDNSNQTDITTMSSLLKMLLQQNLVEIHPKKLQS